MTDADLTPLLNVRDHFPILSRISPSGQPLIYLDSAATALKPQCVIDAVSDMLANKTANIHRSVHFLSDEATEAYESTRDSVAILINAESNEIVFLRNTTEALNLLAFAYRDKGKILTSWAEHHSNLLPWGDTSVRLDVDELGHVKLDTLEQQLSQNDIALVALSQASNVTGNSINIKKIVELAHAYGVPVAIDAAQSAPHTRIDVDDLGCDFLAFSGHKLGAPTGVGVLFGKADLLEQMDLYLQGGSTIEEVTLEGYKEKNAPWKFEAGTPAIESVVGLNDAIRFLLNIGMENVHKHFSLLSRHTALEIANKLPADCVMGGLTENKLGPFSLIYKGISPHAIARGLSDRYGVCVRSGFHCAQPLHLQLNVPASLRLSFWIYDTPQAITKTVDGIAELAAVVNRLRTSVRQRAQ